MALAETTLDWGLAGGEDTVYRGPDRRRASAPRRLRATSLPFGAYLVGSHVVLAAIVVLGMRSATAASSETDWLTAAVAVISALAAGISAVRWRLIGDAAALWVAAALLVYAAANIAFPELLETFADGDAKTSLFGVLRPSSVIVVMTLLLVAALAPKVDAALTPRRVLAWSAGFAGMAAAASYGAPEVRLLFGPAIDEAPSHGTTALGQIGIGCLWLSLGVVFLLRARRTWTGGDAWLALMLMGLAESRLALAMSVEGDAAWLIASQVGRLLGVVAALIGVLQELERCFTRQRSVLLSTDAELSATRARHEAALATAEERAHDLRSALAGIGSAAVTLERYHDHLSPRERAGLARSVAAEIARLQQIVAGDRAGASTFDLAAVLDPVIRCARSQGADVRADVADGLRAVGSAAEIGEVLQNLLDNARRHAPGATVEVRASDAGSRVVVHVDDDGPGVDPALSSQIFERGCHGGAPGSSGLGLYVSAQLVRANGGELHLDDRPGGGASFSFSLPIDPVTEVG
jgi:signal transduction histidine kinase